MMPYCSEMMESVGKMDVAHGMAGLIHHGSQWQRHQLQVREQAALNLWQQGSQEMVLLGLGLGRYSALRLGGVDSGRIQCNP